MLSSTKSNKIIKYTVIGAIRDWLLWGVVALLLTTVLLSMFLGSTSLVEEGQTSIACAAAGGRFIAVIGMILFTCFQVQRAVESREIELMLSRPLSRPQFVISYFTGFAILSLGIVIITSLFVTAAHILHYQPMSTINTLTWTLSLYIEVLTVTAFSLFVALLTRSAVFSVMTVFAFYFLARLIGFFMFMIKGYLSISKVAAVTKLSNMAITTVSTVIPRFDMLTKSEWLLYGVNDMHGVLWCMLAALLYIPFVLSMTVFDLVRKQF